EALFFWERNTLNQRLSGDSNSMESYPEHQRTLRHSSELIKGAKELLELSEELVRQSEACRSELQRSLRVCRESLKSFKRDQRKTCNGPFERDRVGLHCLSSCG